MKKSADPNSDKMKAEFRQKLENYKAAPSENLWDKIELSLDKEEALAYKNRFRVYSWLAAACLALLLAFAAIFVPRKWEQLQNQQAEIAAAKTGETNKAKTPTEAPISADKNLPETNPEPGKLAVNTPQFSDSNQPETGDLISEPGKTVGSKAKKVAAKAGNSTLKDLVAVNTSKSAETNISAAEPTSAKQRASVSAKSDSDSGTELGEVTLAAVSPEAINPESPEAMPQTAKSQNAEVASSVSLNQAKVQARNENNLVSPKAAVANIISSRSASPKVMPSEVISDLSQSHSSSFSGQNPTVSETAESGNTVALAEEKKPEIPQAELAGAQDSTQADKVAVLATEKPAKAEKDLEKFSRWTVTGSYAALSFNSGIRLAGQTFEPKPQSIGTDNTYNQNIANYKTAIQEYNHETSTAYSQKGGLMVSFKMAKKWLLQTGFSYFQNREQTNSSYVFTRNPGNGGYPGTGSVATDFGSPTTLEMVLSDNFDPANSQVSPAMDYNTLYSYQFYSLPLNLRFQTGKPGFYYFAGAGGAVNFLDQTTVEIQPEYSGRASILGTSKASAQPEKDTQPDVYRKSLLSVQLETGLGYSFNSHWSAELAISGNHYLSPLISDVQKTGTKQKAARSFGAGLNLGYTF